MRLTNGKVVLVDPEDVDMLSGLTWWENDQGYALTMVDGNNIRMHRLIMDAPEDFEVDHKNTNRLDNRKANLRLCTKSQNNANRVVQARNTTGYKGVRKVPNLSLWKSRIRKDGKEYYLGCFKSAIEAARAYDEKALEFWGEYARPNNA